MIHGLLRSLGSQCRLFPSQGILETFSMSLLCHIYLLVAVYLRLLLQTLLTLCLSWAEFTVLSLPSISSFIVFLFSCSTCLFAINIFIWSPVDFHCIQMIQCTIVTRFLMLNEVTKFCVCHTIYSLPLYCFIIQSSSCNIMHQKIHKHTFLLTPVTSPLLLAYNLELWGSKIQGSTPFPSIRV